MKSNILWSSKTDHQPLMFNLFVVVKQVKHNVFVEFILVFKMIE